MVKSSLIKSKSWSFVFVLSAVSFLIEIFYLKNYYPKIEEISRLYLAILIIPPIVCSFCIVILTYNRWFRSNHRISNNIFFKAFFYLLFAGLIFVWSVLIYFFMVN